jgi:hypothetical protein
MLTQDISNPHEHLRKSEPLPAITGLSASGEGILSRAELEKLRQVKDMPAFLGRTSGKDVPVPALVMTSILI